MADNAPADELGSGASHGVGPHPQPPPDELGSGASHGVGPHPQPPPDELGSGASHGVGPHPQPPPDELGSGASHGVGPHPQPWPDDPRLDPDLLAGGDTRNVVDRYRYWSVEAIVADLDTRRFGYHVAIENLRHDLNIGTVVRNANAFGAAAVHVVGRRQWNRRGAMVTDRYLHVHHHPDVASLQAAAAHLGLVLVGLDVVDGSESLDARPLPHACVLVFGQEGSGLSPAALAACEQVRHIPMFGSTRSVNVGVASGIAMTAWLRDHGPGRDDGG